MRALPRRRNQDAPRGAAGPDEFEEDAGSSEAEDDAWERVENCLKREGRRVGLTSFRAPARLQVAPWRVGRPRSTRDIWEGWERGGREEREMRGGREDGEGGVSSEETRRGMEGWKAE